MVADSAAPESSSVSAISRGSRIFQLILVLTVAFALPLIGSLLVFFGRRTLHPATQPRTLVAVIFQVIGLSCLALVLKYQKRSVKDIGVRLPMRIVEVAHSFGLFLGAFPVGLVAGLVLVGVYAALGHQIHPAFNASTLFGNHITILTVLFVLLNPFHEELIVRGFLITEVEALYNNSALAIFISVLIQSSYHLYQGLAAALLHASTFWLFSIYFVRTRRILPVVMAHLFLDVSALAAFAGHLAKHN
jgi:membrane protease YdiL (CAAX protease family)